MQCVSYEELIGKRVLHHIMDAKGLLLIPEGTVLHESHVEKLENFNIDLYDIHVEEVPPEEIQTEQALPVEDIPVEDILEETPEETMASAPSVIPRNNSAEATELVKRTENLLSDMDEFILKSGTVPVAELEEKVLPVIMQATNKRNMFQLFADLKSLSDYRYKQSIGVVVLSAKLGKWLGLDEQELSLLTSAACLYDVGTIKLPSYLLNKPDRFLPSEHQIMKEHTQLGYELLKDSDVDHRVALAALQHHEREDGSGYPRGLKGDQIDILSQIIAIADVYTALTSDRPYRPAFAFYEAVQEIHQGMIQGRFNSRIAQTFLNGLMNAQIGSEVELSDGRRGKILIINSNYPTRPLVAVDGEFIDLSKEQSLQITEIIG